MVLRSNGFSIHWPCHLQNEGQSPPSLSTKERHSYTYAIDAQSTKPPPSVRRWSLSGPGSPWTAAAIGDGEERESRLPVGVSSLGGLGLSPREEKKSHQSSNKYSEEKKQLHE